MKQFIIFLFLLATFNLTAQIAINEDGTSPHNSAMLEVTSNNKGVLIPRLTSTEINNISSPAEGLLAYNTTLNAIWMHDGSSWEGIAGTGVTDPIGTIIDWWRPDNTFPIPTGFAICDGSTISDSESPLNGYALPDFSSHPFAYGTTITSQIGTTGGTDAHDHSFATMSVSTSTNGNHTHSVNPPATNTDSDTHNHIWSEYTGSSKKWETYNSSGNLVEMKDYGGGLGGSGSGHYPIEWEDDGNSHDAYTTEDTHSHSVDIPATTSDSNGSHSHIASIPAFNSSSENHLPSYIKVLKLMRIK